MTSNSAPAPAPEAAPQLPDYVTDPDAVLKDKDVQWRFGRAPSYAKTREFYLQGESESCRY